MTNITNLRERARTAREYAGVNAGVAILSFAIAASDAYDGAPTINGIGAVIFGGFAVKFGLESLRLDDQANAAEATQVAQPSSTEQQI